MPFNFNLSNFLAPKKEEQPLFLEQPQTKLDNAINNGIDKVQNFADKISKPITNFFVPNLGKKQQELSNLKDKAGSLFIEGNDLKIQKDALQNKELPLQPKLKNTYKIERTGNTENDVINHFGTYGMKVKPYVNPALPKPELRNKFDPMIDNAAKEFGIDPQLLKATFAQESKYGSNSSTDWRYNGLGGLMGLEKGTSEAQLKKLGYKFDLTKPEEVFRAAAAYYDWLKKIPDPTIKDPADPLKLYKQYRASLKGNDYSKPGVMQMLHYYYSL
jgi:hypothetical protein